MTASSQPFYDFSWCSRIAENFWKSHTRGCLILHQLWPALTIGGVARLLQVDSRRFYVYKRLAKLAERLASSPYYDIDLIATNVNAQIPYFQGKAEEAQLRFRAQKKQNT